MYLTIYKRTEQTQTLDYNNLMQTNLEITPTQYYKTTIKIDNPPTTNKKATDLLQYELDRILFILAPFKDNYEQQYYTFKIPKHSGGFRTINAPNEDFKNALSRVKDIFENDIKCLAHPAAFAYIKKTSILDALKKHQDNQSNWFLKIDLTDFFTNCTPELLYEKLINLYPFYYFTEAYKQKLKIILQMCSLNGGLPQGTPISPYLTNLLMVSYDYEITKLLKAYEGNHFVYTRYADDILISSKANFDWKALETKLQEILAPFTIKTQKTRYGNKAGRNWNLGLMLNKDNQITLGYQKKKQLNAMLNNFMRDSAEDIQWELEDIYHLQGQLSWLKAIEPDYYKHLITKYQDKYHYNYKFALSKQLNPEIY